MSAELQGVPDLIIGNYSDGNLVASLLAYKMGITQVGKTRFFTWLAQCLEAMYLQY
uniref:sucrose synthase n=1 Tax=Solanum tuberosum TaxID=4113 RepID=M1A8J8_SOLTU